MGWVLPSIFKKKQKQMIFVDISHHQGLVNFSELATNDPKIGAVFLKATQGTGYTDSAVKYNASEAKKYGFPVSYYHYATLSSTNVKEDAIAEANYFTSVLSHLPNNDLPIVLDLEENKAALPPSDVLLWANTFLNQLTLKGYSEHMLYSGAYFLNANLPKNHNLGSVPLWLAAYVNKPQPVIPAGWNHYKYWQYTDKGKVKGINGFVDMNKTNPADL